MQNGRADTDLNMNGHEIAEVAALRLIDDSGEGVAVFAESTGDGEGIVSFYESLGDGPVVLRNIADGTEPYDAATVGQVDGAEQRVTKQIEKAVKFSTQNLTAEQQAQARQNIGAMQAPIEGGSVDLKNSELNNVAGVKFKYRDIDGNIIGSVNVSADKDAQDAGGEYYSTLEFESLDNSSGVILRKLHEGIKDDDAATVGQVREMVSNADTDLNMHGYEISNVGNIGLSAYGEGGVNIYAESVEIGEDGTRTGVVSFLENENDGLVRLQFIADGTKSNDAVNVGQVTKIVLDSVGKAIVGEEPTEMLTADYLAKHYVTAFYSTLDSAVSDLNMGTTVDGNSDKDNGVVALYLDSYGSQHLTLLDDISIPEPSRIYGASNFGGSGSATTVDDTDAYSGQAKRYSGVKLAYDVLYLRRYAADESNASNRNLTLGTVPANQLLADGKYHTYSITTTLPEDLEYEGGYVYLTNSSTIQNTLMSAYLVKNAGKTVTITFSMKIEGDITKTSASGATVYVDRMQVLVDNMVGEITVPVDFRINGHTISIYSDYAITFSGNNTILDGRVGGSQIIKNVDDISNASAAVVFSGMNCQMLGGSIWSTSSDATVSVGAILQSAGSLTIDGSVLNAKVTSGDMNAVGITSRGNLSILNSTVNGVAADGSGVSMQSSGDCIVDNCLFGAATTSTDTSRMACGFASGLKSYKIRNSKIVASAPNAQARCIYGAGNGNVEKSELSASSDLSYAYGIWIYYSGIWSIDDCKITVTSNAGTCIGCYNAQGDADLTNCEITISSDSGACYGCFNSIGTASLTNCEITVSSESGGSYGYYSQNREDVGATIAGCKIETSSYSGSSLGCYNASLCTMTIEDTDIFADGTTGSAAAGNEGYAIAIGLWNLGTMTVKNCNVYGLHSGFQCSDGSVTTIDGGVYEGPGHGGIYIAIGETGKFYAENATFRLAKYRGKYKSRFRYEGMYMYAAVYIGGSEGQSNLKAYFDNCIFDGSGPEFLPDGDNVVGAEPIRFRGSLGEQNNSIYISNCTIIGDGKIRFTNSTHTLYTGYCNRILCEANLPDRVISTGRVVYLGYDKQRTV